MRRHNTRSSLLLTGLIALLTLLAVPAMASEHRVSLELEFEGSTCSFTLVTISAKSCDGDDIAATLEAGLDYANLNGTYNAFCAYAKPNDDWECVWSPPNGCTQISEQATIQPGDECDDDSITGQINRPIGSAGTFIFELN